MVYNQFSKLSMQFVDWDLSTKLIFFVHVNLLSYKNYLIILI